MEKLSNLVVRDIQFLNKSLPENAILLRFFEIIFNELFMQHKSLTEQGLIGIFDVTSRQEIESRVVES